MSEDGRLISISDSDRNGGAASMWSQVEITKMPRCLFALLRNRAVGLPESTVGVSGRPFAASTDRK
jgi:hypothetical protein